MPTLTITKNYDDGTALTESQLDDIKTSIETFVNTTKLDGDNIQDLAITTAKIAASSVTQAKRAALGQQISSSCGNFTTSSLTLVDITNLSVTLTTTGRPVCIQLVSDGTSNASYVGISGGTSAVDCSLSLLEDTTIIGNCKLQSIGTLSALSVAPSSISHIYVPSAGTYTYKLQAILVTGTTVKVQYSKLVAFEL